MLYVQFFSRPGAVCLQREHSELTQRTQQPRQNALIRAASQQVPEDHLSVRSTPRPLTFYVLLPSRGGGSTESSSCLSLRMGQ